MRWLGRSVFACLVVGAAYIAPGGSKLAYSQPVGRQECKWVWDCTKGRCKHTTQCANAYDLVPPEPQELPPLAPVDTGAYMPPDVLPAGGSHCPPKRTCDQMGQCVWEVKC